MISKKEWKKKLLKINRLRKRKEALKTNIYSIKHQIDKIDQKLFNLIVPKK